MTKTIMHPVHGAISYDENIWTGKKSLAINGKLLPKGKKNVYILGEGESAVPVTLNGNALTGVTVTIGGQKIVVLSKLTSLEYILSILPFALVMIWGNVPALCSIIPVVGGAIGGGLSALASVICVSKMRDCTMGKKVLTSLLATLAAFLVCAAIGFVMVLGMIAGTM